MKKELTVLNAINCVTFYNQVLSGDNSLDALPLKIKWALKRAVEKMAPDVTAFEELREKEITKVRDIYFDEEHSFKKVMPKLDDSGNPVIDNEGNPVEEEVLQVKDEYIDEYKEAITKLNEKLTEITTEKNTYEYNGINMDDYIDSIDDSKISFEAINMIDAILGERD